MGSSEQLIRAVQVATRALVSTGTLDQLMSAVLSTCVEAVGAEGGTIYVHDGARNTLRFQHVIPAEIAGKLPSLDIPDDFGAAGQAFQSASTVLKEFPPKTPDQANDFERATGVIVRSMAAAPLVMEGSTPVGVVQLINKKGGPFTDEDRAVLETIAAVSTMGYLNAQLTEEASRASTLLGMGKVSHDIGNLAASLHATIGYAEPAIDSLCELIDPDDDEVNIYVDIIRDMTGDLHKSIDRIVGYSRLISDLSAGRPVRPQWVQGPLGPIIENSAAYLATEGRRNHVELTTEIDETAPPCRHDELFIFRIVQNLVGNSIKAVRETIPDAWIDDPANEEAMYGKVRVTYTCKDGEHRIAVHDSGPGMTPEIARRILSGTARSMWDKGSGSGWGTKIVLELANAHEGKLDIESEIGKGSSFVVTFPHIELEPEAGDRS
ncbi:MAG: GAF domain-containing sensor histidine kinase [Armatimonadetes bacterium]|nr:GAF domain-containing sensor histidine kinase [Armatimonadota bacterium]